MFSITVLSSRKRKRASSFARANNSLEKGFLLNVNEGPFVFERNEFYYLMYSGNEAFTYSMLLVMRLRIIQWVLSKNTKII